MFFYFLGKPSVMWIYISTSMTWNTTSYQTLTLTTIFFIFNLFLFILILHWVPWDWCTILDGGWSDRAILVERYFIKTQKIDIQSRTNSPPNQSEEWNKISNYILLETKLSNIICCHIQNFRKMPKFNGIKNLDKILNFTMKLLKLQSLLPSITHEASRKSIKMWMWSSRNSLGYNGLKNQNLSPTF